MFSTVAMPILCVLVLFFAQSCLSVSTAAGARGNLGDANSVSPAYELVYDVSTFVTGDQWQCLATYNCTGAIVRAWRSNGSLDPNAAATMQEASNVLQSVDAYMFPCVKCGDYQGQVDSMLNDIEASTFNKVWLDVEGEQYWYDDPQLNLQIFELLIERLIARLGKDRVGVYCSPNSWSSLMGNLYTPFSSMLPLWYPHYDGTPNFTDWSPVKRPMTGWDTRAPAMKQYTPDLVQCGATVDISVKFKHYN